MNAVLGRFCPSGAISYTMARIAPLLRNDDPPEIPNLVRELRERLRDNIRRLAARRGWSMQMVADRAGVSRSQLFNVLGCRASPRLDWVARVALVLEVEVAELLAPPPDRGV